MKKIIVGICGLLVFILGLAGVRSGALKAGELIQESSSLIAETETTESVNTIQKSSERAVTEEGVPDDSTDESDVPVVETSSDIEVSENSESSTVQSSASTESSETTQTSSETSSTDSSCTIPGTSSSSGATKPTTVPSDTEPPMTQPSWSEPSSVSSNSVASTQPSTSPSISTPASMPVVPNTPAPIMPETPSTASVQSNTFGAPRAPAAFEPTSNLNLPSELKATEVVASDLNGFELPLLNTFKEKALGALVYEGIRNVGIEQSKSYDTRQLVKDMYEKLFEIKLIEKPKKMSKELTIGSLIYQKKKKETVLQGIYIGEDYYLAVDDVTKKEDAKKEQSAKEEQEKQRQVVVESLDVEEELLVQELPETTLTAYGKEVLADYPAAMNFTENDKAKAFIEKVGEEAQKLGQEYDVFASVMIAQALIESGSGTSTLSLSPNHNLFGIKGTYKGQSISMATQEDRGNGKLYSIQSAFRKYPNHAASLGDYVQLLRGGISGNDSYYKRAWRSTAKNYLRTTDALTGTYATDTTYGKKLNSIIALYHLTKYDQPKIDGGSGLFIKEKKDIPAEYKSRLKYPDFNGVNYNGSGSYPVGQCTWYAFNRVKQLGKTVDDYMGNGGQWAVKGKALGYQVSQKPKAGWLISFKPGTAGSDPKYGHVAFVEAVRPEGILISEANVYGGTKVSYRIVDKILAESDEVAYIKPK